MVFDQPVQPRKIARLVEGFDFWIYKVEGILLAVYYKRKHARSVSLFTHIQKKKFLMTRLNEG